MYLRRYGVLYVTKFGIDVCVFGDVWRSVRFTALSLILCYCMDSNRPLHVAACWSRVTEAELLLNAGCDVNEQNSSANTPLHLV